MGFTSGWHAKYYFFHWYTGNNGYDTTGLPSSFENYPTNLNFPNDQAFMSQYWWFPYNRYQGDFHGHFKVDTPGKYTFTTESDDGSRLIINDEIIVDNWGLHGKTKRTGFTSLTTGWHSARVNFFENGGAANLVVNWQGPDTSDQETLMPAWH